MCVLFIRYTNEPILYQLAGSFSIPFLSLEETALCQNPGRSFLADAPQADRQPPSCSGGTFLAISRFWQVHSKFAHRIILCRSKP